MPREILLDTAFTETLSMAGPTWMLLVISLGRALARKA